MDCGRKYTYDGPVHEVPTIAGSGEGQMYVALILYAERLFMCFKLVTLRLQWTNHTILPRLTLYDRKFTKSYYKI